MATEGKVPSVREQIPTAEFIEDLGAYMSKEGTPEAVIEKLQRMYSALKFIEQKLTQRKAKLKSKIPEIEATYGALKQMRSQAELGEPLVAHYELAQSVYAKAKVNVHEEDKVCLWLGANVMLEYPRDEAILLLEDNLKNAKAALVTLVDDMGHLRDQITVTEVNMARVFNWDVKGWSRRAASLRAAMYGVVAGSHDPLGESSTSVQERRKKKEAEAKGEAVES